jgi:hypothetical protein
MNAFSPAPVHTSRDGRNAMNLTTIHKQRAMMPRSGLMSARPHGRMNLWYLLIAITLLLLFSGTGRPQEPSKAQPQASSAAVVPVTVTVSVETKHAKDFPVIYLEDVRVFQGKERLKVTQWVPAEVTGLQLMVVVDDACDTHEVGQQLRDLRKFILAQPKETAIGVGYMSNSNVRILQDPTKDHARAAKAVRLPMGRIAAYSSPYLAITDLIKGWPDIGDRRAIFMVSPGIDGMERGPTNPYLDRAVEHAQRAKVSVSSIYCSGAGFNTAMLDFGQSNLLEIANRTGGEAYFQGSHTPLSFTPYLQKFGARLGHQYKLTFLAYAEEKDTTQHIRIETEVPGVELEGPARVRIPGVRREDSGD